MNDILSADKLVLLVIVFIPGFISVMVYDLLVPGERRDFSKSWWEAVAYSFLNLGILSPFIFAVSYFNLSDTHPFWFGVFLLFLLFLFPVLWPFVFIKISERDFFKKRMLNPIKKPWDWVFGKKEPYWVIVYFKDGSVIGGVYSNGGSFASSFPAKEQIYLEQVWEVDVSANPRKFLRKIERTKGVIILGDDVKSIELLQ